MDAVQAVLAQTKKGVEDRVHATAKPVVIKLALGIAGAGVIALVALAVAVATWVTMKKK